jgi:hypothetical protein
MAYVEVSAKALEDFLASKGFTRGVQRSEVVYDRVHHRCPHVTVRVYTSLRDGAERARACGKDAIRVVAFRRTTDGRGDRGVAKATRVFRTGTVDGVLARLYERMRSTYGQATLVVERYPCPACSG